MQLRKKYRERNIYIHDLLKNSVSFKKQPLKFFITLQIIYKYILCLNILNNKSIIDSSQENYVNSSILKFDGPYFQFSSSPQDFPPGKTLYTPLVSTIKHYKHDPGYEYKRTK